MLKKLPIGIQSFANLREEGYLYVDKTEHIHNMISGGSIYFLSRPRRFGKSLLVSTLDALFSGRKELFDGLFIYDKWDWTRQHPVIRLDFGARAFDSPEELKVSLNDFINGVAKKHQLTLYENTLSGKFGELIENLYRSTGQRVVVLVDEYDKPITDHLSNIKTQKANKDILHGFYQVLKASDDYLQFIFMTGVSKFSGLSVFSALNNVNDITIDEEFASICGYTQAELEECFSEHIDAIARFNGINSSELLEDIRRWYNGYSWDGRTSVYNPFSTLSFFRKKTFYNYWFRTGTPTFLIEILKKRNQLKPVLGAVEVGMSAFDSYDPTNIDEISLLFQTGYLTIKSIDCSSEGSRFTLGIPNREVRESFLTHLVNAYSNYPTGQLQPLALDMQQQIRAGDASGLEQSLRLLLAHIPSILHVDREAYWHSLFLLLMKLLGFDIQGEVLTNVGRIDAVWRQPGLTVVAEIKYHTQKSVDALLDEAIAQIRDRRYYEAYLDHKTALLAIAFTEKEVKCRMEKVVSNFF